MRGGITTVARPHGGSIPATRISAIVQRELRSEGLPPDALGSLDPDAVQVARTASRSVLGFADSSLPAYDAAAAALLTERVLAFLDAAQADEKS